LYGQKQYILEALLHAFACELHQKADDIEGNLLKPVPLGHVFSKKRWAEKLTQKYHEKTALFPEKRVDNGS
jgi:hypothetical protein